MNNAGFGNDPTNWFAVGTSAGRANLPNTAPQVSIQSPADGAEIQGTNVTVSVVASDPGGAVAQVQLWANGSLLGQWAAASSNFVWTGVSSGTYTLQARVTDNLGAVSLSSNVTITVVARRRW